MSAVAHPDSEGLGHSAAMARVYDLAAKLAAGHTSVMIFGERGTYPESIARFIHDRSPRARNNFVRVSRPALTEAFVDEHLFGGGDAAFPNHRSRGLLAKADGGSLFFEEISDFSLATQGKLLALLSGEYNTGDERHSPLDVRLLAASALDLERLTEEGRFRRDLFEFLSVATLRLPPLRERRTDVVDLAYSFLKRHARDAGKPVTRIAPHAVSALLAYDWPGNIEELDHVVEHAVLLCDGATISLEDLPAELQGRTDIDSDDDEGLQSMLENVERTLIIDALRTCGGNQAKAATMLRITERLMGLRVKKYGIDPRQYRTNQ